LGSDVRFFLDDHAPPRPALVTGLGERVERLGPCGAELVLILASFACPTGAVYAAYDRLGPRPLRERAVRDLAASGRADGLFNDLAPAAECVAPGLDAIRRAASQAAGLPVHVTGSGSALFVVCPPGSCAQVAARIGRALRQVVALPACIPAP